MLYEIYGHSSTSGVTSTLPLMCVQIYFTIMYIIRIRPYSFGFSQPQLLQLVLPEIVEENELEALEFISHDCVACQ